MSGGRLTGMPGAMDRHDPPLVSPSIDAYALRTDRRPSRARFPARTCDSVSARGHTSIRRDRVLVEYAKPIRPLAPNHGAVSVRGENGKSAVDATMVAGPYRCH
jgi:hypothetical protein